MPRYYRVYDTTLESHPVAAVLVQTRWKSTNTEQAQMYNAKVQISQDPGHAQLDTIT